MNPTVRALDLGDAAGWRVVRALPQRSVKRMFEVAADGAGRRGGPIQLRRNLARVLSTTAAQVPDELVRTYLGARLKSVAIALSASPSWCGQ
ncbi:hypothetical protein [Rhodococcus ruber]|uniref:LpxL/LpxP family acyltransferase n=1 Tax=Rhodococcus ruber TaxID=1830 RepID=UPI002E1C813E